MSEVAFVRRCKEVLDGPVKRLWDETICQWPEKWRQNATTIILLGIFTTLREMVESSRAGRTFEITPKTLKAGKQAELILGKNLEGHVREVDIWVDTAIGLPPVTLRISTGASGTASGGVSITPGAVNPLGRVPPDTQLFAASDVTIPIYVIERT